ncbi:hypothetical protein SGLAM104S_10323 [Streptomyces glaucescens]
METSVSAPLGMLACWEAPSVELYAEPGETVLLYTDGLLRRTGDPTDRAFARLHAAAAGLPAPSGATPRRSSTTCCARSCRTGWTRPTTRRTWCCSRPGSSERSVTGLPALGPFPYDRTMGEVQCRT